ncbi:MAG: AMP-binding protein, partial [Lentilitoribacter sp.]
MSDPIFPPADEFANSAHISKAKYDEMYASSVSDPDKFWGEVGKRLDWIKPYSIVKNTSFEYDNVSIKWFEDGVLNVCANCVDRHLETRGDQTAIIWEGDDPTVSEHISYNQLHEHVSRLANAYKSLGVSKGDRVILYMPMIPEAAYAMLACARIGAVHSIVFGGFSPDALASRVTDCGAKLLVTADEGPRGGKNIPLKKNVDAALEISGDVTTIVVKRTGGGPGNKAGRDHDYGELVASVSADCPVEPMNAEDPLFILYTSGSTGKPKGVLHTSGGYLTYAAMTHEYVFDYHDGDIYWCTA